MEPDVAAAIEELRQKKVLEEKTASKLLRLSRRELVSANLELRMALYAGVLLFTTGIGILLKKNLTRLAPLAVSIALGLGVMACFIWIVRHAPSFAWGETPAEHLGFDYILLLGVLLGAADLAYIEAKFTPLGPDWSWHLLLVSLAMGAIAVRWDSRIVFSLSLSTFAAWRGVSTSVHHIGAFRYIKAPGVLRANAIACGILFIVIGYLMKRTGRKPHFEPAAVHIGWICILSALVSGIGTGTVKELIFAIVLLFAGVGLVTYAATRRRFSLAAMGLVASYIGTSVLFLSLEAEGAANALFFLISSTGLLWLLFYLNRKLKVKP